MVKQEDNSIGDKDVKQQVTGNQNIFSGTGDITVINFRQFKTKKLLLSILLFVLILLVVIGFVIKKRKNSGDRFNIRFVEGMTLQQAIEEVAEKAKFTPKFINCDNKLGVMVKSIEIHAKTPKELIEKLQYNLINKPNQFRYKIEEHKEEKIYEIICE